VNINVMNSSKLKSSVLPREWKDINTRHVREEI